MGNVKDLIVKILVDDSDIEKFERAGGKALAFGDVLDRTAIASAAALAGLATGAVIVGNAASEAEQAAGAVEAVFADQAANIMALAEAAHDAVGLSTTDYSNLSAVLGSQLKNMGVANDALVPQTETLIALGADMAATLGGSTSDAVAALSSLLRGERDPIEQFGVTIKQADINARLAAMGLSELTGEEAKAAETQAVLALVTEQTAHMHGTFAKEADSAAGAQQRSTAAMENASAELGTVLLPMMAQGAEALAGFAGWATENAGVVQVLAGGIAVLAAGVLLASGALKVFAVSQALAKIATDLSTKSWYMNTAAMLSSKAETIALGALYAKDFVVGLARTAAGVAVSTGAWIANTAALGAAKVALMAGAVATGVQTAAQWASNAAWLASPITWIILAIIAAIALLVAAGIWLYENWDEVTQWLGEAWQNVADWFVAIGNGIAEWWNGLWSGIGSFLTDTWNNAVDWAESIFWGYVQWLYGIGSGIADWWNGLWSGIGDFFGSVWAGLEDIVRGAWNGIIGWIEDGVNNSINLINGIIRGINNVGGAIGIQLNLIPNIRIPRLATGGITLGPQLAMVGDNPGGREAIIPLDSPAARDMLGGSDGPMKIDRESIDLLARAIAGYVRVQSRQGGAA